MERSLGAPGSDLHGFGFIGNVLLLYTYLREQKQGYLITCCCCSSIFQIPCRRFGLVMGMENLGEGKPTYASVAGPKSGFSAQ